MIPFAVRGEASPRPRRARGGALRVAPFRPLKVGLVATTLPSLKPSVMDKTRRLLEERLAPAALARRPGDPRRPRGSGRWREALAELKAEGCDLLVAFGASATVDEGDVGAGGDRRGGRRGSAHFGMPVDPGNLLVLGDLGGTPVIGAPGCARSPKENGFDWVLQRLLAGLPVTPDDLTGARGRRAPDGDRVAAAAARGRRRGADREWRAAAGGGDRAGGGAGRRMGGPNKLAATIGGRPLSRIAAEAARGKPRRRRSSSSPGTSPSKVRAALAGLDVSFVHNPDYADGLSTSLRRGVARPARGRRRRGGALADMPAVDAGVVDRLIAAFDPAGGTLIVVPTFEGKRGNPVLWSRRAASPS